MIDSNRVIEVESWNNGKWVAVISKSFRQRSIHPNRSTSIWLSKKSMKKGEKKKRDNLVKAGMGVRHGSGTQVDRNGKE